MRPIAAPLKSRMPAPAAMVPVAHSGRFPATDVPEGLGECEGRALVEGPALRDGEGDGVGVASTASVMP